MGKINWQRVFLGGVLWAVIYNVIGAASWYLFLRTRWTAMLAALGIPSPETTGVILPFLLLTFIVGFFALWLYAAIRPRYGPGPKTAVCAGLALWVIVSLANVVWGILFLRLPTGPMVTSLANSLVAVVVSTVAGAWSYKEES